MALRKRQEHNLETYVSFVDLVKAFDSVPRAALFKVLSRYGLPDHFINLLTRLHADAVVNFKRGNEEVEVSKFFFSKFIEYVSNLPTKITLNLVI